MVISSINCYFHQTCIIIIIRQSRVMQPSLAGLSALKQKIDVTPKVTLTKTTIVKSSPFLISRHHLDDTQMKQALRYQESESTYRIPRSYSYKGERMTYQQSKLGPTISHGPQRYPQVQSHQEDYYADGVLGGKPNGSKVRQVKQQDLQMPYFKNSVRHQRSNSTQNNTITACQLQQHQKILQKIKDNEEKGLKQMQKAREHLQKEAKKLRRLYKYTVQKSVVHGQGQDMITLQEEIRQLKIKTLELEKTKLVQDLDIKIKRVEQASNNGSAQKIRYTLNYLLLNKPKYREKPNRGQDTDSSFSSLQLS